VKQTKHLFGRKIEKKVSLSYLLYLPREYDEKPDFRCPLLLFLHGMGERGDDLELVKKHGIPKIAEERDFPFVAISPQCPLHST
jgi:predicted peptidase